jgi:hypothetical protein
MARKKRRKQLTREQAEYILDMQLVRMFKRWWFVD